jgi:adenosylmethionine-8-amino-7-oxononanoate aminotransferase
MTVQQEERNLLFTGDLAEDLRISRAEGSFIYDDDGNEFVDFVMGWCVGNLGWGHPDIRQAAQKSLDVDYIYPGYSYEPWANLAELLKEITPGKLSRSFRATGGTEAVEIALQVAMLKTGRGKFVSLEDSYHGNSIGTLSIGASENRGQFKNLLKNCKKIETPLNSKAADKLETLLKKREVAAFIMEPISMNLGVEIPDQEFMERLQQLCQKYGTLLIADEVACGFGRTGKLFACEHYDLEPDILCVGKAISGGYAGLGATITTDEIAKEIEEDFSVWSTYGWHPRSVEAAIANIRYMINHKNELLHNINQMSNYFQDRLSAMNFKEEVELKVKGLAIGLHFQEGSDYSDKIQKRARKNGLLLTGDESLIWLFPALNIDKNTAAHGLDILEQSL